jgi:hypothetical protein
LDNGNAIEDDVDADIDMDDVGNEDWILDDIGGGMEDEPEAGRWNGKDGVVKEMGILFLRFFSSNALLTIGSRSQSA